MSKIRSTGSWIRFFAILGVQYVRKPLIPSLVRFAYEKVRTQFGHKATNT